MCQRQHPRHTCTDHLLALFCARGHPCVFSPCIQSQHIFPPSSLLLFLPPPTTNKHTAHYGVPRPPDIASQYWRLGDSLPVELMAGSNDGIIPPVNVRRHYTAMQAAGMKVRVGGWVGWAAATLCMLMMRQVLVCLAGRVATPEAGLSATCCAPYLLSTLALNPILPPPPPPPTQTQTHGA